MFCTGRPAIYQNDLLRRFRETTLLVEKRPFQFEMVGQSQFSHENSRSLCATMNAIIISQFYVVLVLSASVRWNGEVFATTTTTRPNIVFILADDLGYRDVGYQGSSVIKTPTLDRLAYGGVRLDNYYTMSTCTPSRSSLLSGRYQIHTGLQHKAIELCQANSLPKEIPTLADMLHDAGYATHMVGKWHVGHYADELLPTERGFDSFFGFLNGKEHHYIHTECTDGQELIENSIQNLKLKKLNKYNTTVEKYGNLWCGLDLRQNKDPAENYSGQYSTHLYTQKATDVIRNHASKEAAKPLFLYLSYQANHSPLMVPESYSTQYVSVTDENRRIYAGMMTCMDEGVVNITSALEEYGLWNNTILIFSTDNGGDTIYGGNNWPLRGEKGTLWEGGIRGVAFVHSPLLRHRAGTVSSGLIHINDWFPTLVALAGGDTTGLSLDGYDVWKTIAEGNPSPREEILHNIDPVAERHGFLLNISNFDNRVQAALLVGNWKLITGFPSYEVRVNDWIAPPEDTHIQSVYSTDPEWKNIWLFDISSDPSEKTDLFETHRDIAVKLLNKLAEYQSTAIPARYPLHDLCCDSDLHNGFWSPWRQLRNENNRNTNATQGWNCRGDWGVEPPEFMSTDAHF